MPKIKITQQRAWGSRFRVVDLYLDGEILGYVPNGEILEFDVPAGQHSIKAKMGFLGSNSIHCTMFNKEMKSFTIAPNVIQNILLPILLLCLGLLHVYSKRVFKSEHYDLMAFYGILLVSAYTLIFGRKRHLIIKEG